MITTWLELVATTISALDCPEIIEEGFALIVTVGALGWVTVTVACAVAVAVPDPFTVMVKVVVWAGVTGVLPLSATVPIPLLIVADEAWAEIQVKVALAPATIVVGEAAKVTVGGIGTGVATEPAQPVNKPVVKPKVMHSNRREVQGQSLFMSVFGCSKGGRKLHL
jgi:hypothetical protein